MHVWLESQMWKYSKSPHLILLLENLRQLIKVKQQLDVLQGGCEPIRIHKPCCDPGQ